MADPPVVIESRLAPQDRDTAARLRRSPEPRKG